MSGLEVGSVLELLARIVHIVAHAREQHLCNKQLAQDFHDDACTLHKALLDLARRRIRLSARDLQRYHEVLDTERAGWLLLHRIYDDTVLLLTLRGGVVHVAAHPQRWLQAAREGSPTRKMKRCREALGRQLKLIQECAKGLPLEAAEAPLGYCGRDGKLGDIVSDTTEFVTLHEMQDLVSSWAERVGELVA